MKVRTLLGIGLAIVCAGAGLLRGGDADAAKPLTDEECRAFAQKLEASIRKGDGSALIDLDALLKTVMEGISVPEALRQGFVQGFMETQKDKTGIREQIVAIVLDGGTYTFLRIREKDGQKTVLFRMLTRDGKLNYHELILVRAPDGLPLSVDHYIYLVGERISTMLHRGFLPAITQGGLLSTLLHPEDAEYVRSCPKIMEMNRHIQDGEYSEALATYKSLPLSVQKMKNMLILRLKAAQNVGPAEYTAVMQDFKKYYPGDSCLDFIMLDHYFMRKEWKEYHQALDRLYLNVGGDPYLRLFRGIALETEGRNDDARAAYRKAIEEDPAFKMSYFMRINLSAKEKKWEDLVSILSSWEARFPDEEIDLTRPLYAEFLKTPQYEAWVKSRPKRDPPKQTTPPSPAPALP